LVQQVSALFVPLELQSAAIFAVFLAVLLVRAGRAFSAPMWSASRHAPEPHPDLSAIAILTGLYSLVVALNTNDYHQYMLTIVPIFAVLGLSWNVLGRLLRRDFLRPRRVFLASAPSTVAFLTHLFNVSPWIGIPAGVRCRSAGGRRPSDPTLRLRGVHLRACAMLAYPLILATILDWAGFRR